MPDINIKNLGLGSISREDIKKQFANDKHLDKILLIFDKINSLDGKVEDTLSERDLYEMGRIKCGEWPSGEPKLAFLQNKFDDKITDYELSEYLKEAKSFYGEDIQEEDYRKFLGFVAAKGDEVYANKLEESSQKLGMSKDLIEKLGGVYIAGEFERIEKNGKVYYEYKGEGYTELRDENGRLLQLKDDDSSIIGYEGFEQVTDYDERGGNFLYIYKS